MKKIITFGFFISGALLYSQGIDTQTRDDAGASGVNVKSGFYQTWNPINFPAVAQRSEWWHLLDIRHTEPSNNYAMQFSGSFFDQNLYFRKTNNNANQSWNQIWHSGNLNNTTSDFTTKNLYTNGFIDINANGDIPQIRGNGGYIPAGLKFIDDSYNTAGQVKEWAIFKGNGWQKGLAFMRYDAVNRCIGGAICDTPLVLFDNGEIQIGVDGKSISVISKMSVQGNMKVDAKLEAKEVKVTTTPTADFVFAEDYALPKLEEVEKHIKEKKHLPEIASAVEMEKEGVNIGEFQIKLLQKIEELTLYSIEQNKKLQFLESENKELKSLIERVEKLEKSAKN